jgi:hypothetical protein
MHHERARVPLPIIAGKKKTSMQRPQTVTIPMPVPGWASNVMRHALMADVSVQAPVRITFPNGYGNLAIEDAMAAHRIAQLPVCGSTPCTFTIDKTAPADASLTWVTSDDIADDEGGRRVVRPQRGRYFLVPLLAGQRFCARAETVAGSGRQHTLWASVFVAVQAHADASVSFCISTTGAQTPQEAWTSASTATLGAFRAVADAATSIA